MFRADAAAGHCGEGGQHGGYLRRCGTLVSRTYSGAVAHAHRRQSRLAVRRLREPMRCSSRSARRCARCSIRRSSSGSRLTPARRRDHAARLGHRRALRRHPRRLYRPQADDDLRHSRLFDPDRADRAVVRLGIVRAAALSRRHGDRLGMGDRVVDDGRAVAAEGARQRRRTDAMRSRARFLSGFVGLALCRRPRTGARGDACSSSAFFPLC